MRSIVPRGKSDRYIEAIRQALAAYEAENPRARIALYRRNPASIRIRIIDPRFAGLGWTERNELAWKHLEVLPEDVQNHISMLLLLAPAESKTSVANDEFERPSEL